MTNGHLANNHPRCGCLYTCACFTLISFFFVNDMTGRYEIFWWDDMYGQHVYLQRASPIESTSILSLVYASHVCGVGRSRHSRCTMP